MLCSRSSGYLIDECVQEKNEEKTQIRFPPFVPGSLRLKKDFQISKLVFLDVLQEFVECGILILDRTSKE